MVMMANMTVIVVMMVMFIAIIGLGLHHVG
jgi:hypothetical protein